jgi:hypothetical protein
MATPFYRLLWLVSAIRVGLLKRLDDGAASFVAA